MAPHHDVMVWCKTPQPSAPGVGAFETDGVGVWHQHQLRIILFFEITWVNFVQLLVFTSQAESGMVTEWRIAKLSGSWYNYDCQNLSLETKNSFKIPDFKKTGKKFKYTFDLCVLSLWIYMKNLMVLVFNTNTIRSKTPSTMKWWSWCLTPHHQKLKILSKHHTINFHVMVWHHTITMNKIDGDGVVWHH